MVDPTIKPEIFTILLRFRKDNFVLIGDLAKMYRRILIYPKQQDLPRILYRNEPTD